MKFTLTCLLLPVALASPILNDRQGGSQGVIPGEYIAVLKSDSIIESVVQSIVGLGGQAPKKTWEFGSFKALHLVGTDSLATQIKNLAQIASLEPNSRVTTQAKVTQDNAPWGLARISHKQPGQSGYVYDDAGSSDIYAYVIDTGVKTDHPDFGGRATFGMDFTGEGESDGNGHGTHVAGTIGSTTYGVAKKANIVAVRVLGSDGSGSNDGVISGIMWAAQDCKSKNRKCVANMSLGGPGLRVPILGFDLIGEATNAAVREAIKSGLFMAIAAGNSGAPTLTASPGNEESACTVGATDINDNIAEFSNWGRLVDVFAPGVDIESTWNDGRTNIISGTSMATPHVAGLAAYFLGKDSGLSTNGLCEYIAERSNMGVVKGLTLKPLSPNKLIFNQETS